VSWATQGLLDAIRKFDPEAGTAFSTYARIRVRGAVLDELRGLDWASRTARQKANRLRRTVESVQNKLGRDGSQEEVAAALGVSIEKYHELRGEAAELSVLSLEDVSPGRSDDHLSFEEFLPARQGDPVDMLLAREKRDALHEAIDQLPGKERLVASPSLVSRSSTRRHWRDCGAFWQLSRRRSPPSPEGERIWLVPDPPGC